MNKKYYETEQRILCYTIDYLDQNSAASLYNNRICNDLKISKHTFYDHFGNIACLYEKVIDFIQDSQKSFMEEHYDINHHDIKEFIASFLDYLDDHRNYLTAYNKIKEDHGFSLVSSLFKNTCSSIRRMRKEYIRCVFSAVVSSVFWMNSSSTIRRTGKD